MHSEKALFYGGAGIALVVFRNGGAAVLAFNLHGNVQRRAGGAIGRLRAGRGIIAALLCGVTFAAGRRFFSAASLEALGQIIDRMLDILCCISDRALKILAVKVMVMLIEGDLIAQYKREDGTKDDQMRADEQGKESERQ